MIIISQTFFSNEIIHLLTRTILAKLASVTRGHILRNSERRASWFGMTQRSQRRANDLVVHFIEQLQHEARHGKDHSDDTV